MSDLKKCLHGVYDPDGTGKARYCHICTPPVPLTEDEVKIASRLRLFYPERNQCPRCCSKNFVFKDEWNYLCLDCGANGLE